MTAKCVDLLSDETQNAVVSALIKGKSVAVVTVAPKAQVFQDLLEARMRKGGVNFSSSRARGLSFVGERGGMLRVVSDKRVLQGVHPQLVYSDDAEAVKWAAPYVRS